MEETCPHLGAPLSHAEIEIDDIENTRAVGELSACLAHKLTGQYARGTSTTLVRLPSVATGPTADAPDMRDGSSCEKDHCNAASY